MSNVRDYKTDDRTISSGRLSVGNGHQVYYEQWGNPRAAVPVLTFHGGPGGNYKPNHKYGFNPDVHQLICFDQRGCGNSLPYGELAHNTTDDLLNDAVMILDHLGIAKVHIYGRSWGSTLALLFAERYPERVSSVIVSGIFTATRVESAYVDQGLFRNFYPEVWERFIASVPESHASNPAKYHYDRLAHGSEDERITSAMALEDLELPLLMFDWPGYSRFILDRDPEKPAASYDYVPYQIYAHYMSNNFFLDEEVIMRDAGKLTMPLYIVQGRYDMVCPPVTAYRLHQAVPHSKLLMTLSSHGNDPETRTAIKALVETVFV